MEHGPRGPPSIAYNQRRIVTCLPVRDAERETRDPAMDERSEKVRAAYQAAAPAYDREVRPTFVPIARRLATLIDPYPGERGLDLATGSGLGAEELPRRASPLTLIGLDLSLPMIAHLRARAVVIRPVCGDALALPFRDKVFDWLTCQFGLHHFADVGAALAEARRVTRVGGRLAIAGWHDATAEPTPLERAFRDLLGKPDTPPRSSGPDPARDAERVREAAQSASWQVELEVVRVPFTFPDSRAYYRWRMAFPGDAHWLSQQSPEQRAEIEARVVAGLDAIGGSRPTEVTETVFFLTGR